MERTTHLAEAPGFCQLSQSLDNLSFHATCVPFEALVFLLVLAIDKTARGDSMLKGGVDAHGISGV